MKIKQCCFDGRKILNGYIRLQIKIGEGKIVGSRRVYVLRKNILRVVKIDFIRYQFNYYSRLIFLGKRVVNSVKNEGEIQVRIEDCDRYFILF